MYLSKYSQIVLYQLLYDNLYFMNFYIDFERFIIVRTKSYERLRICQLRISTVLFQE